MLCSVVFVHGLTGNRQNTWTHEDGVFWPKDLLPEDVPTARIMTFGYDADVVGIIKTAGSNTLRDHGKSLANDLAMRRARSNSTTRPLIFVAHSLGGLLVEQVRQTKSSWCYALIKMPIAGPPSCQRRCPRPSQVAPAINLCNCVYGDAAYGIDQS